MSYEVKSVQQKNGRLLKLLVAWVVFLFGCLTEAQVVIRAQNPSPPSETADGAMLFKLNCSSSYCHGELGKGGGAPSLRGRTFETARLGRVIGAGMPGTAMPAFGWRFSALEMEDIVTYTRSLSALPLDVKVGPPDPSPLSPSAPGLPGEATAVGESATDLAAGRNLFFDATVEGNCRVCHSFQGKGGKVGPDLTGIGTQSEEEIRASIVTPNAKITFGFEALEIATRDGLRVVGVKRDENAERIRLFDTSTTPPVSRSIEKSEIVSRQPVSGSVMPLPSRFTDAQLRALIAFLRAR